MSGLTPPNTVTSTLIDYGPGWQEYRRNEIVLRLQDDLKRVAASILRHYPLIAKRQPFQDAVGSVVNSVNGKLLEAMNQMDLRGRCPQTLAEFMRYAVCILRNTLNDRVARVRRRKDFAPQADPDQPEFGGPQERVAREQCVSVLAEWEEFEEQLEKLDDDQLLTYVLHFNLGLSQAEIADALNRDAKSVSRAWREVKNRLAPYIPGFEIPKHVLLVAGGDAFTSQKAMDLFKGWNAIRITAVGRADQGKLPTRESVEAAGVVVVTRPEYADLLRQQRDSALVGKPLECLDIPDAFDPTDTNARDTLWRHLTKLVGD